MRENDKEGNESQCSHLHQRKVTRTITTYKPLPRARLLKPAVSVLSGPPDIDVDVVEEESRAGDQTEPGSLLPLPSSGDPSVEIGGIGNPGDEGPGLLGIPTPVTTPSSFCPDRSGDDGEGPDRKDECDQSIGELIEGIK